ncbi:MAG: sodium/glutamate symporter [Planctomycetota bacterium]
MMLVATLFVIVALAVGTVLRVRLKLLQWCFVPASIVAGFLGFAVVQLFTVLQQREIADASWLEPVKEALGPWPGTLISVVFACMLLERTSSKTMRESMAGASREGIMVWIVVLGQTAVGLLCTWLLIQPFFDVPNSFGILIETGFAGGHGTASAMGDVLESDAVGLPAGRDLGLFMATMGLIFSVTTGVVYVNLAIRRGWVQAKEGSVSLIQGLENRSSDEPAAFARIRSEVLDPFLFQVVLVGIAFGIGWSAQQAIKSLTASPEKQIVATEESAESMAEEALQSRTSLAGTIGSFPLFIYTLFGGLLVRVGMRKFGIGDLIDTASIQRISSISMDFLIVAAITLLNVEALQAVATPLFILLAAALLWTGFCLLVLAPRLLPKDYWFQLGIINYGMSTGTTATGFTLLKIVDRKVDSGAAEDYALAAPLSSPFIGGGMLTIGLPMLVLEKVPIAASALVASVCVVALYFLGRRLASQAEER